MSCRPVNDKLVVMLSAAARGAVTTASTEPPHNTWNISQTRRSRGWVYIHAASRSRVMPLLHWRVR